MSNYDIFKEEDNNNSGKKTVRMVPKYAIVIIMVLVMVCLLIGGIFIGYNINSVGAAGKDLLGKMPLLEKIYALIDKYYYEAISWDELEKQVASALAGVDNFSGISILGQSAPFKSGFTMATNVYGEKHIASVVDGSPADEANNGKSVTVNIDPFDKSVSYELVSKVSSLALMKLERGDKIIAIRDVGDQNNHLSTFIYLEGLNTKITQQIMSSMMLYELIVQKFDGTHMLIELGKSMINNPTSSYQHLGNGIGYIQLDSFDYNDVDGVFDTFYKFINDHAASKLVLDLRGNGGGNLSLLQAIIPFLVNKSAKKIDVCKFVLKKGETEIMMGTEYVDSQQRSARYLGTDKINYQLSILVDGGSASASETLLGAVRYHQPDNTVVVGSPTYGKGVGQLTFDLSSNMVIALTAGKFYVPIDVNGKMEWKNYHTVPMLPDYDFYAEGNYNKMYSIMQPDIAKEPDVAKAIELMSKK